MDVAKRMEGNLTATIHGTTGELRSDGNFSMFSAKERARSSSTGFQRGRRVAGHGPWRPVSGNVRREGDLGRNLAIERFAASSVFSGRSARDFAVELEDKNPFGIWRLVDGQRTRA